MFGSLKQILTGHAIRNIRVRRASGEQLDDGASKRPDIRSVTGAFQLNNLRSHPVGRASNVLPLFLHRAQVAQIEGNTKVGELDVPGLGRQNVSGLEIAVNDVALVEVVETVQDLDDVAGD
jgi:hypothetical protein